VSVYIEASILPTLLLHRDAEVDTGVHMSEHAISLISAQLMKDRNVGKYANYGQRLHAEAVHELERKQALVTPPPFQIMPDTPEGHKFRIA